ncbi:DUF4382 domain-containing protein [Crassaminicella thermophila]|uniref:DUF4382 domain-containing protein n=1 Tax=Crassaminicella thermophila TaxID=2599308 RepID=A0A5C0SHB3_CRATE|nr:DUF4382 domain-containing protein [Crassaminicella thermophila]QEK13372.1 DUF4382 domain-containing protein [Crassaminicella thermophila]
MKKYFLMVLIFALIITMMTGCGASKKTAEEGQLIFVANGEDFVREGFVSKDGWHLTFDHVYITLADIKAYQTNPPYDAESEKEIKADVMVSLDGIKTVDLAEGDTPVFVGKVEAPVGHYNALSWKMVKAADGENKDTVLTLVGKAQKDGKNIDFRIKLDKEYEYLAGEYIGDERKGIVDKGQEADLEMTFHFDHMFGDFDTPLEDGLNVYALGFEPFSNIAKNGKLDVDINDLKEKFSKEDFEKLMNILPTLGHVGEGHAHAKEL